LLQLHYFMCISVAFTLLSTRVHITIIPCCPSENKSSMLRVQIIIWNSPLDVVSVCLLIYPEPDDEVRKIHNRRKTFSELNDDLLCFVLPKHIGRETNSGVYASSSKIRDDGYWFIHFSFVVVFLRKKNNFLGAPCDSCNIKRESS